MESNRKVRLLRVNIGCGQTPTPGWINCDNSASVRIARLPFSAAVIFLLTKLHFVGENQKNFVDIAKKFDIRLVNAAKRLPFADGSLEVLYASHILEYLDRDEVRYFLRESLRVLCIGGCIRIAGPDLKKMVNDYLTTKDADEFIGHIIQIRKRPSSFLDKLRFSLAGYPTFLWMYDEQSSIKLLLGAGFKEPRALALGQTTIKEPEELNLRERPQDSFYVEARK